jgi:hypothetical protein
MEVMTLMVTSITSKWRTFKPLRWVQLLNRLVDLDDILCEDDNIEYYPVFILFNPVASTISKWRTFKLLIWVHLLERLVNLDEILYCDNGMNGDLHHFKMTVYSKQSKESRYTP